ncbi:MAG: tryptophan--tRNA ligase [Candidatus Dojkabacteria bacterium]
MNNFELLKEKLNSLGISHKLIEIHSDKLDVDSHVAELGIKYREGMSTLLFKLKGESYLALLRRDDRNINSKALKKYLGSGDFTFCSEEDLRKLNIEPGLASPLILNDSQKGYKVRVLVDSAVLEMSKVICGSASSKHALEINKEDLLKNIGEYEIAEVTEPNPRRQDNNLLLTVPDDRQETQNLEPATRNSLTRKRILTGDRPTGPLHLGHYLGSIKNRAELQDEYDLFYLIADVQALTDNYDNPEKVRDNIYQVAQDNIACGVDPEKTTILIQSMIPEIAELTVYFMNLVTHNEILRNPTVKTEIKDKSFGDSVPFGFVAYPISQAADILFCRSDLVPVGIDQAPMVELAREIGKRFNRTYKSEIFHNVQAKFGIERNLVGTDGDSKMSKSKGNTINLIDDEETVRQKVKKMYTDPNRVRPTDPGKVEGNPVFIYHDYFNPNIEEVNDLKERYLKGQVGDVEVKEKLAIAINKFLDPIRERRKLYPMDKVKEIVMEGTEKARKEAQETMKMVKEAMKINYF